MRSGRKQSALTTADESEKASADQSPLSLEKPSPNIAPASNAHEKEIDTEAPQPSDPTSVNGEEKVSETKA